MVILSRKIICVLIATCFFIICGCSSQSNNTELSENQQSSSVEKQTNGEHEENNNAEQNSTTSENLDEQDPNKICVDCIFSVGIACRPSGYLRDFNLRFQAAPLDWMSSYSLDTVAHLYETKFSDFFVEIEEVPEESNSSYRCVRDTKNQISSIHHFKNNVSLSEEQEKFRETMLNRANKVDEILKNSSSIALICDRSKVSPEELISFLKRFSKVYPNKKIVLINIKNSNIQGIKKDILFDNDNLKVIQFTFRDTPSSGNSSEAWKGNKENWASVIKNISLTGKFTNSSADSKVDF